MKLVIIMCTGFAMIDYLVSDSSDTERFNTGTPAVTVSLHRGVRRAVGFEMGTTKDHLSGRWVGLIMSVNRGSKRGHATLGEFGR